MLKCRAFLEENFMLKYRQKQAFTLSELLVVVAIVGILVAISIPVFASQREKARRAVDMDTARKIKSALVLAYNNRKFRSPLPPAPTDTVHGLCFATAQQNTHLRLTATTEKQ